MCSPRRDVTAAGIAAISGDIARPRKAGAPLPIPRGCRILAAAFARSRRVARIDDIPEPTRSAVLALPCPPFADQPFLAGPPLSQRRVAIISSAALHPRGTPPFPAGTPEVRMLPADLPAASLLMSHISINFDRTGFQRDINTAYPIDRLRELAAEGMIGGVAATHYAVMGSTDPRTMAATADQIAGQLRQERIDAVLLTPV